jgi:hypothetical protein
LAAAFEPFGLAAGLGTVNAAERAALYALAASLPGGKLGKLDFGFATVFGNSDGLRPFFFNIAEYISNLFNRFTIVGPVSTIPGD